MIPQYRLKLFFVLLAFAIVVTFTFSTIDYLRLKQQTIEDNETLIEQATDTVKYALKTIDKAYFYLDEETAEKMEQYTYELQEKYEANPNFETWNFDILSENMNMDIYILDEKNKIIHSNVTSEVGLDFAHCCQSFNSILHERRNSGELFIDGIDLDQQSGDVKKFSYMATEDRKYLIELGYSLKNEAIFEEFNFLKIAEELKEDFSMIEGLYILNYGGLPFGEMGSKTIPAKQREAFEKARDEMKTVEITEKYNGKNVMIRYVPYQSEYDFGDNTSIKIVEMIYDRDNLDILLHENTRVFISQLFIILVITILVSSFISNWFATPVYMAFHDSLTQLKNRAAFDDFLQRSLMDKEKTTALLMMDLDNFKLVNDYFGHGKGDYLLQLIAKTIKNIKYDEYEAFRLGGDEFALVMSNADKIKAEQLAQEVILALDKELKGEKEINTLSVTVSIGIALSSDEDGRDSLYKKADIALYESKEKGKNQYHLYDKGKEPNIPFMK